MSLELFSHPAKRYLDSKGNCRAIKEPHQFAIPKAWLFDFLEKKVSVERMKRQRILANNFLGCFTLKHYPSIFLDQRLKSR